MSIDKERMRDFVTNPKNTKREMNNLKDNVSKNLGKISKKVADEVKDKAAKGYEKSKQTINKINDKKLEQQIKIKNKLDNTNLKIHETINKKKQAIKEKIPELKEKSKEILNRIKKGLSKIIHNKFEYAWFLFHDEDTFRYCAGFKRYPFFTNLESNCKFNINGKIITAEQLFSNGPQLLASGECHKTISFQTTSKFVKDIKQELQSGKILALGVSNKTTKAVNPNTKIWEWAEWSKNEVDKIQDKDEIQYKKDLPKEIEKMMKDKYAKITFFLYGEKEGVYVKNGHFDFIKKHLTTDSILEKLNQNERLKSVVQLLNLIKENHAKGFQEKYINFKHIENIKIDEFTPYHIYQIMINNIKLIT